MKRITAQGSAGFSPNELPTVAGTVSPALAAQFQSVPTPILPEFTRLPRPRERCPVTGSSRTWLIELNDRLPVPDRFLFRIRPRGKMRGAVFVNVGKLMAYMQKAQADDVGNAE